MFNELASKNLQVEELNSIIEHSSEGIYVTDQDGRALRVNQAYQKITHLNSDEVIGRTAYHLLETGVFDQMATVKVMATWQPASVIQQVKTGARVLVVSTPLLDNEGHLLRVVSTVHDIIELDRLRNELGKLNSLQHKYKEEIDQLKQKLQAFSNQYVARSTIMRDIVDLCLRVAEVDSTVFIQGETGVGKERIAEIIHNNSPRRNHPFIKINCSAIPESLLESELFGYVRGAFTGANREGKTGLLAAANGGTLLLDEIGDMPLSMQAKILRVIQECQFHRLGDSKPCRVDVRFVTATNKNLEQMIHDNTFREDLYYRLSVVPIHIPPLRQRPEDILPLAQYFLQKFTSTYNRPKVLDAQVNDVLYAYSWPGNVRELQNVIERLVVTSRHEHIRLEDLPANIRYFSQQHLAAGQGTLKQIMENVERQIIEDALRKHKNTRKAAMALGIDQSNVVRKAKRLGIRVE